MTEPSAVPVQTVPAADPATWLAALGDGWTPSEQAVALTLAVYATDQETRAPLASLDQIAADAGFWKSTVHRAADRLLAAGFLTVHRSGRRFTIADDVADREWIGQGAPAERAVTGALMAAQERQGTTSPTLTMRELADLSGVSLGSIHGAVTRLVADAAITVETGSGRRSRWTLTTPTTPDR